MALPQVSYQQALNYIEQGPQPGPVGEKTYDLSNDTAPTPAQAPQPSTSAAQQVGGTQPTTPAPAAPRGPQPLSFRATATSPQVEGPYGEYFGGVAGALGQQKEKTQAARTGFETAAGPSRTYESAGAQGTLESAIAPTSTLEGRQGRAQSQEAARGFVGARYGGPSGLDQSAIDAINASYRELAPKAQSYRTGAGVQELIRGRAPGLTTGQLRFEAQRLLGDEGYQRQAAEQARAIEESYGDFLASQRTAEDFAKQRAGEEEDIANRSRAFLESQRGGLQGSLAERVAAANAETERTRNAFDTFQKTGELNDLAAIRPDLAAQFNTPQRQLSARAAETWQNVIGQFDNLKDVPLMVAGISSHGFARRQLPREWVKENRKKYTKRQWNQIMAQATERQNALEKAGFSPDLTGGKTIKNQKKLQAVKGGEFASVMPLYFGNDENLLDTNRERYEVADPRAFLNLEGGAPASEEQIASDEERQRYNAVQDILGGADRLDETTAPYIPAAITDETGRYAEEEAAAEKERQKAIGEQAKAYLKIAKKSRKKYTAGRTGRLIGKTIGSEKLGAALGGLVNAGRTGDVGALTTGAVKLPMTAVGAGMDKGTFKKTKKKSLARQVT